MEPIAFWKDTPGNVAALVWRPIDITEYRLSMVRTVLYNFTTAPMPYVPGEGSVYWLAKMLGFRRALEGRGTDGNS